MSVHYIGADVHVHNTEICVENRKKIVNRYSVPTSILAIREVLQAIPGKKKMAGSSQGSRHKVKARSRSTTMSRPPNSATPCSIAAAICRPTASRWPRCSW